MTIGLFGSCATYKSKPENWREVFLDMKNVEIYNPQKEDWHPDDAKIEKEHLYNDDVIVFAITEESFSFASILEVYFSILRCIEADKKLYILIEPTPKAVIEDVEVDISKLYRNAVTIVTEHFNIRKDNHISFTKSDYLLSAKSQLYSLQDKLSQYVLKIINGKSTDNKFQYIGEIQNTNAKDLFKISQSMRDNLKGFIRMLKHKNIQVCESIQEIKDYI